MTRNRLKFFSFLIFLLLRVNSLVAQDAFSEVDKQASRVNGSNLKSIHGQLVKGLSSDEQKVRAFYYWIAHNILYDVAESKRAYRKPEKQDPNQVLLSRKAVCHGYSALFDELCKLSDIKSYLVSGYTRIYDKVSFEGHTWNVIFINGKWNLVDITWAAGGINNRMVYVKEFTDRYFLTDPEKFIEDHLPFDPVFQLLDHPFTPDEFRDQPVFRKTDNAVFFNYTDTLKIWNALSEKEQLLNSANRAYQFSPRNPLVIDQRNFALINAANLELQKANELLKKMFPPKGAPSIYKTETERKAVLDSIEVLFDIADVYYKQATPVTPEDKRLLDENKKALQYNRDIVKSERH